MTEYKRQPPQMGRPVGSTRDIRWWRSATDWLGKGEGATGTSIALNE